MNYEVDYENETKITRQKTNSNLISKITTSLNKFPFLGLIKRIIYCLAT